MQTRKNTMTLAALLVWLTAGSLPCLAANGDRYDFNVCQRENGQALDPVGKFVQKYEDTTAANCHNGVAWCTKTATHATKLLHWHNVDTELSAQQKTRADTYIEFSEANCTAGGRVSSASIVKTCHSWALAFTEHIVGPDNGTVLSDDYTEVSQNSTSVGDRCKHANNHTSSVSETQGSGCSKTVTKVKSKWGWYGAYETGKDIYGDVSSYWH